MFGKVSGWAGALSLAIGMGLLFFDAPPFVERIAAKAEPAFFLVVFALTLGVRLLLSPWWQFRDEQAARDALERAIQPALTVHLSDPPVLTSVALGGSTSESLAGSRQTIINRWQMDVVALVCSNEGGTEAEGCRARILSAVRIGDGGALDLGVVEAVSLPWDKQNPEGSHVINILPSETHRFWLGGVRSTGHIWLFRDTKALPLDYQRLLGEPGTYRVLIQVDARNVPPQQIAVEIVAGPGEPVQNAIQRGTVAVTLIAQASPRLTDDAWRPEPAVQFSTSADR